MQNIKSLRLVSMVFLAIGTTLLIYPVFSNKIVNEKHQQIIKSYNESIEPMHTNDVENSSDAEKYNNLVRENGGYGFILTEDDTELYYSALNPQFNGVMGYISIAQLDLSLPIYHSTSQEVLQIGIGHIESSSLPIGGSSNHSILAGHSGMSSAKMFSEIDQLQVGDQFIIHVLGEKLYYEIYNITVVFPNETKLLKIQENEDICTLITCTPHGANTHRLLVQGRRIESLDDEAT